MSAWRARLVRVPLCGERRVVGVPGGQRGCREDPGPVTVTDLKDAVVAWTPA